MSAARRRVRTEAKRRGQAVTKPRLAQEDWVIFVTNVPAARLSVAEALVLARARWQIELLFKLWKSHGAIAEVRSAAPWRVLSEVYAKLIAMVLQHWTLLVGCWASPDRSPTKAAATVRQHALSLALAMRSAGRLPTALATLRACLAAGGRMNPRKTKPNTYQLLLACDTDGLS